jgi:hypothetical protein
MKRLIVLVLPLLVACSIGRHPTQKSGSPHVEAIQLVAEKENKVLSHLAGDWWTDIEDHVWRVTRTWGPGYLDTTHSFLVIYTLSDKHALSWLVDTRERSVQSIPPEDAERFFGKTGT